MENGQDKFIDPEAEELYKLDAEMTGEHLVTLQTYIKYIHAMCVHDNLGVEDSLEAMYRLGKTVGRMKQQVATEEDLDDIAAYKYELEAYERAYPYQFEEWIKKGELNGF